MPEEVSIDKGAFRVKDWWWSKAALLMGMVYLFTVWFGISFNLFFPLALLSLCTIIGFASFGYLMNDLFDIKQDMLAGKKNFLAGKPPIIIAGLFIFSLVFMFLPWIFLPSDKFSYYLITFQLLLFLVYSVPPIRLKERGLAGIMADAFYAHAVPPILAAYTFSLAGGRALPGLGLVLLFAWQFTSGIRNILIHQSEDIASDRKSGSKNFAADFSDTGFSFSVRYLIITELAFSLVFFVALAFINPFFIGCILAILIISAVAYSLFYKRRIEDFLYSAWRFFPNNLYEKWLPPLFLLLGCFSDWRFVIILLMHIALFNFDVYRHIFNRIYVASTWLYHTMFIPFRDQVLATSSALVNYSIYYALLLFRIDLKKENTSALGYFRKKWGKS